MSTYESDNNIKIIGKDKRKAEHSLVSELIEFEDIIQVRQIWYIFSMIKYKNIKKTNKNIDILYIIYI